MIKVINSYIALGYTCNHKCINCPLSTFDRLHGELDRDGIINNVKKLSKNKDNLHITISGGEPTLNPNFLDVLKILGESNSYITILSNSTTCKDENMVFDIIIIYLFVGIITFAFAVTDGSLGALYPFNCVF